MMATIGFMLELLAAAGPGAGRWRPFLDPLDMHGNWLALLPPLVIAISLVYKTLKLPSLDRLVIETLKLSVYILLLLAAAAVVLYLVVELVT